MKLSITALKVSLSVVALALVIALILLWFALKDNSRIQERAKAFVGDTEPLGKAPANANDLPTDVIIWKITIGEKSNVIDIKYDAVARHTLPRGQGIDNYLKLAAKGGTPSADEWKKYKIDWKPRPHDVERETPLSLDHRGYSYMVFILDEKNWQFTTNHHPVEVLKGKEKYYLDPKCAWIENGQPVVAESPRTGGQCKVASFISDSRNEPVDDNGRFLSPFNFYVSLRLNGQHGLRFLPLVVDPDVGYPGGNAPVRGP